MVKKYVCIPRSFLVINVCNQGKTLCSPCISNKMKRYTVLLYPEIALHISGGTSTHHQERIQLYLQHQIFVTPLLLPAAIAATLHSFIISGNCSTCFGWYLHPSSGAHTTVFTASGICHTVTATCCDSGW